MKKNIWIKELRHTIWCINVAFGHHSIKLVNCSQEHFVSIKRSLLEIKNRMT